VERAVRLGISDFAEESVSRKLLALRVEAMVDAAGERQELREEAARARSRADRDALTGLAGLDSFREGVEKALDRARRGSHPAALL